MSFQTASTNACKALSDRTYASLASGEQLSLGFACERQVYVRFNHGRIRQITDVEQYRLKGRFQFQGRCVTFGCDLEGDAEPDWLLMKTLISQARLECAQLPADPHASPPENLGTQSYWHDGTLPSIEGVSRLITELTEALDFAGLYAGGDQVRIASDSEGTFKSFATRNFFLDYSLYTRDSEGADKSLKGLYADQHFSAETLAQQLQADADKLKRLEIASRSIKPGSYRTYLEPPAVGALIGMLSWDGVSYAALRRGESALEPLFTGKRLLSPHFTLEENFTLGLHPDFNEEGESSPESLSIIREGRLENLLVTSRTAREFAIQGNGASAGERLRSPVMATGSLDPGRVLETLGTGLYLSNLHYLNWSDRPSGRMTGMTRHACFWVEDGAIVSPIRDLRFDESLYHMLGDGLEAVTRTASLLPETGTYEARSLGGSRIPGILIDGVRFTL